MPVVLYQRANFEGPFVELGVGFYTGRDALVASSRRSLSTVDLTDKAASARVDAGYVAALYDGLAVGSGGRVLVGPAEVDDLATVGLSGKVSSVEVFRYDPYALGGGARDGVTLFSNYQQTGMRTRLRPGDYDGRRLRSAEVELLAPSRSLCVAEGVLAVLYAGPDFDQDAAAVQGPECVENLGRLGFDGQLGSVRVLRQRELSEAPPRPSGAPLPLSGLKPRRPAKSGPLLKHPPSHALPPPRGAVGGQNLPGGVRAPPRQRAATQEPPPQKPAGGGMSWPKGPSFLLILLAMVCVQAIINRQGQGSKVHHRALQPEPQVELAARVPN